MGNVINLISLEGYLKTLKAKGGMWEFKPGKWIIKHLEVEGLAQHYNIETHIDLVHCDLDKDVAVVKAAALYKTKKFITLGEASPKNNQFDYPVAIAEKRAVDRAVKYSQSSRVAMHDKGFNTAVFFYLHSSSGYAKKELHG